MLSSHRFLVFRTISPSNFHLTENKPISSSQDAVLGHPTPFWERDLTVKTGFSPWHTPCRKNSVSLQHVCGKENKQVGEHLSPHHKEVRREEEVYKGNRLQRVWRISLSYAFFIEKKRKKCIFAVIIFHRILLIYHIQFFENQYYMFFHKI